MYLLHLYVLSYSFIDNTPDFSNLLLVWLMPYIGIVALVETKQTRKHFTKNPPLDKPTLSYHATQEIVIIVTVLLESIVLLLLLLWVTIMVSRSNQQVIWVNSFDLVSMLQQMPDSLH